MSGDLHTPPDLSDDAFVIHEKRGALHAHEAPAVQALLNPDPIVLCGLDVGVGSKRDREFVLLPEFVVRFDAILRYTDDRNSKRVEFSLLLRK